MAFGFQLQLHLNQPNIQLDEFLFCIYFRFPLDQNNKKPSADLSIYCTIVWLVDGGGG